jgi:hypothetical protein
MGSSRLARGVRAQVVKNVQQAAGMCCGHDPSRACRGTAVFAVVVHPGVGRKHLVGVPLPLWYYVLLCWLYSRTSSGFSLALLLSTVQLDAASSFTCICCIWD